MQGPEPRQALHRALQEKGSVELRRGHKWHIGNLTHIDRDALFFALGRTTRSQLETFDESSGDFVDTTYENAPYTYALVDLHFQVCAIAAKLRLAKSPVGIANRLAQVLNLSRTAKDFELEFTIDAISDPAEFIELLDSAIRIRSFSIEFAPPNPWDAEKDFQQPMQRLLEATHSTSGKTSIKGDYLDKEPLKGLARAAAAAGDNAQAWLDLDESGHPVSRKLRNNPAKLLTDDDLRDIQRMRGFLALLPRTRSAESGESFDRAA
jgi:hypothetical protein